MGQGPLTLPTGGTVYLDAQIFIYTLEKHPTYGPLLSPLWQAAAAATVRVATSELSLMEVLVMPARLGDTVLQHNYETVLSNPDMVLQPISQAILRRAAHLRASLKALRTPDAIHAATALELGCAAFVTNDAGFRRILGLPISLLGDSVGP